MRQAHLHKALWLAITPANHRAPPQLGNPAATAGYTCLSLSRPSILETARYGLTINHAIEAVSANFEQRNLQV